MDITFYILEEANQHKAFHFTCHLVEKAYQQQERVFILMNSLDEAEQIDRLLWTYRDDSFIPHKLYDVNDQVVPLIQIGFTEPVMTQQTTLLNFSNIIPTCYQQFAHIIEIVFSDPTMQQLARERFKQYRDKGHHIITHKIKASSLPTVNEVTSIP